MGAAANPARCNAEIPTRNAAVGQTDCALQMRGNLELGRGGGGVTMLSGRVGVAPSRLGLLCSVWDERGRVLLTSSQKRSNPHRRSRGEKGSFRGEGILTCEKLSRYLKEVYFDQMLELL